MAREMSPVFMIQAKELFDAGKFSAAIMTLQEGLQQYPHFISARVLLGEIFWTSGDASLARTELEQVIKAVPDNFAAHRKLALIYRAAGDLPAAIQSCRSVLQANPRDLEMRVLLDQLQGAEGQGGEVEPPRDLRTAGSEAPPVAAVQELSVALPADSDSRTADESSADTIDSETLAELYIVQGHREKGLQVYHRLAAKYPGNARYRNRIETLEPPGVGVEAPRPQPVFAATMFVPPLHPPAPESAETDSFSLSTPAIAPSPTPELAKTSSFSRSPESAETDSLSPLANRRETQVRRLEGWLQVIRARRRV
jgi:hypothetical protein